MITGWLKPAALSLFEMLRGITAHHRHGFVSIWLNGEVKRAVKSRSGTVSSSPSMRSPEYGFPAQGAGDDYRGPVMPVTSRRRSSISLGCASETSRNAASRLVSKR